MMQRNGTDRSGRRRGKRLTGVVALASIALVGPAFAAATSYSPNAVQAPNPASGGRWGERTVSVDEDLNGDTVKDVWVGVPGYNSNVGRVYAMSGASMATSTPVVLYTINSPTLQAGAKFGFATAKVGDLNGDGKPEVVVGTDAEDVGGKTDQGKAWVFNGANGTQLPTGYPFALDNPAPQSNARFGSRIKSAGDIVDANGVVGGDGKSEILVGASGNDMPAGCGNGVGKFPSDCRKDQGQAFIFNGANGNLVRTLDLPLADRNPAAPCQSGCGSFGLSVQGPGDTDGDTFPDQVVSAPSLQVNGVSTVGRMYVFSGATGANLVKINDPAPHSGAYFGFNDVAPNSPGDVSGDFKADVYGNGFYQTGPGGEAYAGRGWVFDGATGAMRCEVVNPSADKTGDQFGWSMAGTDHAGDGTRNDLYVGNAPHHLSPAVDQRGDTNIYRGSDCAHQRNLPLPAPYNSEMGTTGNYGPNLGWAVAAPGNLNGSANASEDYIAGAPYADVSGVQDQGVVIAHLSNG